MGEKRAPSSAATLTAGEAAVLAVLSRAALERGELTPADRQLLADALPKLDARAAQKV